MAITKSEVDQLYRDLLGREPDEAGAQWWTEEAANENMSLDDLKTNMVGAALYNQSQRGATSQESANATLSAAKNLGIEVADNTVSAINTQTANRVQTATQPAATQIATQATAPASTTLSISDQIAQLGYRNELGREPDQAGLQWWTDRTNELIASGMPQEQAIQQTVRGINADIEGVMYDKLNPDNAGLAPVQPTAAQQTLLRAAENELGGITAENSAAILDVIGNVGTNKYGDQLNYDTVASALNRTAAGQAYDQANPDNTGLAANAIAQGADITRLADYLGNISQNAGVTVNTEGLAMPEQVSGYNIQADQAAGISYEPTPVSGQGGSTGQPIDYYGTGGTGGIIGSQPSDMLTPFQKSVMAQNQALLGTYGSTAPNLNPYTQMVTNQALSELDRQRQMTTNDIGYQATQAGAFGGSRHGVAEALTNEAFARQGANMVAPLMYQGYQAGVQNELNRAAQMANLGQQSFNYGTSINQMLSGAGAQQQALQQAQIDAAKAQTGAYQTYPATGAGTFAQILGAAPTGQTSSYNPGVMDYLTVAASAAPYFITPSDIRLKKNIKKVGELANGLGVYTWEWKEKVKDLVGNFSMTKGVMAQEAMKVIPEAVVTAPNGYLAVDYSHPELSGVA